MSIVNDKMNANKPPPTDAKGKLAPGTLNNNKDLDVDVKKEDASFFGSFFSNTAKQAASKKKGAAAMEAVSFLYVMKDGLGTERL